MTYKIRRHGYKKILACLIAKGFNYCSKESEKYTHGGLSTFETLVPYAIFEHMKKEQTGALCELKVHTEDGNLRVEVKNRGSIFIKELNILLRQNQYTDQVYIPFLGVDMSTTVKIPVKPGDILEQGYIQYEFDGMWGTVPFSDVGNTKLNAAVKKNSKLKRDLGF